MYRLIWKYYHAQFALHRLVQYCGWIFPRLRRWWPSMKQWSSRPAPGLPRNRKADEDQVERGRSSAA